MNGAQALFKALTDATTTPPTGELTVEAIGQTLCALMPDNSILVDEAATNGPQMFAATKGARAHDYLSPVSGGAIGGGFPMALGAAIACPDRKIILVQADGSGMYTVQALWSAWCHDRTSQRSTALRLDLPSVPESSDVIHSAKARTARRCRLARGKTR
jgi:thiamine pyrophosphate-dependent acetolactate synthase large subunit-like protein